MTMEESVEIHCRSSNMFRKENYPKIHRLPTRLFKLQNRNGDEFAWEGETQKPWVLVEGPCKSTLLFI